MTIPARPRRILITCDAIGGVWRHALDMVRALAAHDVGTVLVAFGPEPSAAQREEARETPGATLLWFDHALDWLVGDARALEGIPAVLEGVADLYDVDLLHLNYPSQARGLATTRPVIAMSHSCLSTWWAAVRGGAPPGEDFERNRRLVREGLGRADRVLAPSRSHANALTRAYGRLPGLAVVRNASFASPLPPEPNDGSPRALAIGRWWDEGKNARVLDAAAALASTPITAIGSTTGPSGESFGFAHAEAPGALPPAETRAALARAAVFVSPSRYEPFGLAVLEAAQEGCALVLADIPTFRELWEDVAVFVDPDDATGFAEAIDRIAGDARLHAWHATQARSRAAVFAPQAQAARLLDIYAEALAAAPDDIMRPARVPARETLPAAETV